MTFFLEIFSHFDSPVSLGVFITAIVMVVFGIVLRYSHNNIVFFLGDMFLEKVYDFYESIVGIETQRFVKIYIIFLFFVLFLSNMIGVALDILAPFFGLSEDGDFFASSWMTVPSASLSFNLALSGTSMVFLLIFEFGTRGTKKLYDFFPVWGSGYLTLSKEGKNPVLYALGVIPIKIADIVISLFLGLLDMIGVAAKVVSLAFRLFGNMTSGTVLLAIAIAGMSGLTEEFTKALGGFAFPVVIPVIIYLQEILVAGVQAMVFALLVAVFFRIAQSQEIT